MKHLKTHRLVPHYRGKSWLNVRLPRTAKDWTHGGSKSLVSVKDSKLTLSEALERLNKAHAWEFPKQRVCFLSDLHGDPEALAASLVATGCVKKTGPGPLDFQITEDGKTARFVIGGDCFDKGPSSLGVLRGLAHLRAQGGRVRVLAGNHDLRVFLGLASVGTPHQHQSQHLFIRTGPKILPLLKEIRDAYITPKKLKKIPSTKTCRRHLFPSKQWFTDFPHAAKGVIKSSQIKREIQRVTKKMHRFEAACHQHGLTLREVYAAALKWQDLFLSPNGEFAWFFQKLRLGYQAGAFLFVHAGVDNTLAGLLFKGGIKPINQMFRAALKNPSFDFYYGSLCNSVRTKYRDVDRPFCEKGARKLRQSGIAAIVHGHRNVHFGQRLASRRTVLHFECDTSLDRNTRAKENVRGAGAAATIIDPRGYVLGISSDYPHIKIFHPQMTEKHLRSLRKARHKTTLKAAA